MSRFELLDRESWAEFLQAPSVVLMLAKSDCDACKAWSQELQAFLAEDEVWTHIRFGKLELDQPGLGEFKRLKPWLADADDLPYNILYANGERLKDFLGTGTERLVNRMRRLFQ